MAKKSSKKFTRHATFGNRQTQRLVAVLVVTIVAGIGLRLLIGTHAASPYATANADKGTLGIGATSIADSTASDGHHVQFGSTSSSGGIVPTPPSMAATYKTVSFDDEFTGTSLNTSKWENCIWYDPCDSATDISDLNGGTAHPANVSVNNGLTLIATSSTPTNAQSWSDGYIDSAPHYETPNGNYYVEFKAKLPPPAPGLWPALVLYGDNDIGAAKPYAELDLLERVYTYQPSSNTIEPIAAWSTWHPAGGANAIAQQIGSYGIDLTGWNTYGVSVSSTGSIQFWFNGTATGSPIAGGSNVLEGMFLNAVMSTGGTPFSSKNTWAGVPTAATPSPSAFNVAYARVFTP